MGSLIKAPNVDVGPSTCYSTYMNEYDFSDNGINREAHALIEQHALNRAKQMPQWELMLSVKEHVDPSDWPTVVERFKPQPELTPAVAHLEALSAAQESVRLSHVDTAGMYCGDDDAIGYRAEAERYYALVYMEVYMILLSDTYD